MKGYLIGAVMVAIFWADIFAVFCGYAWSGNWLVPIFGAINMVGITVAVNVGRYAEKNYIEPGSPDYWSWW